jgi:two-component system OmpR family response regulator
MKKRILIVDDNQDMVDMLKALLRDSGWEVGGARTAAQARTRIDGEHMDVIILDSRLPDGNGVELCRELRARSPNLPIIFLTGATLPSDLNNAAEAGCSAYLVKPCSIDELTQVINQLMSDGTERAAGSAIS